MKNPYIHTDENGAKQSFLSLTDLAKAIGVSHHYVSAGANEAGVVPALIEGNRKLYSAADLPKIRRHARRLARESEE